MKIISHFLREQKRYTKNELASMFEFDEIGVEGFIKTLKAYNILKAVKYSAEQREMTDLIDEDVEVADETAGNDQHYYVFVYVGVITVGRRILKIYPKYLLSANEPLTEMKQVLKVLEKYSNSEEQIVNLYNGDGENRSFNLLAVILFLLNDYYEYGIYNKSEDIVEVNGEGEILWNKTIDENFPIISENRPYYMELYTHKSVDDETDFFKRLHEAVLTECSRQLDESQLSALFEMVTIHLTDEVIDDFGDRDYILGKILSELSVQFNTRRQILLKTIYTYISQDKKMLEENEGISMYGTTAFNMVWEKTCAEAFNNRLQSRLKDLSLPKVLDDSFNPKDRLIDIIEKPNWVGDGYSHKASDTLIPDLITIIKNEEDYQFIIFDAKYYNLHMEKEKTLRGYPGIESVTKQYLYQLAYKDFVEKQKIDTIKNCFLLPDEGSEFVNKGHVSMEMLNSLGLEDIQICLLPSNIIFSCYINNKKVDIKELGL